MSLLEEKKHELDDLKQQADQNLSRPTTTSTRERKPFESLDNSTGHFQLNDKKNKQTFFSFQILKNNHHFLHLIVVILVNLQLIKKIEQVNSFLFLHLIIRIF